MVKRELINAKQNTGTYLMFLLFEKTIDICRTHLFSRCVSPVWKTNTENKFNFSYYTMFFGLGVFFYFIWGHILYLYSYLNLEF
jgi:hypothetical protein